MGPLIVIGIGGICVLAYYINSLKVDARKGEMVQADASRYYHKSLELERTTKALKEAHAKATEEAANTAAKQITELKHEASVLNNALRPRKKSEPWLASYISQLQTAKELAESERRIRYAPKTARELSKLIREKYRPALNENSALKAKLAEYESLFPSLPEHIEIVEKSAIDYQKDGGRSWLSDQEYNSLTASERNQLVLDRYHDGKRKTKWQIGRDYELYIGHVMKKKGYTNIIQYGIEKKLEDLGIDIIATNPHTGKIAYIQCKHWSKRKQIRENTVTQLYGGALIHMLHHNQNPAMAEYIICTSTKASDLAKHCAKILGVQINEEIPIGRYPSIKCHIDNNGTGSRIYHLPIDQMYDRTHSIDHFAYTVEEAERLVLRHN